MPSGRHPSYGLEPGLVLHVVELVLHVVEAGPRHRCEGHTFYFDGMMVIDVTNETLLVP